MASTEYDRCSNCLHYINCSFCKWHQQKTPERSWCKEHSRKRPLDATDAAVEYSLRLEHALANLSGKKVRPLEEYLITFGWDGVSRLRFKNYTSVECGEDLAEGELVKIINDDGTPKAFPLNKGEGDGKSNL